MSIALRPSVRSNGIKLVKAHHTRGRLPCFSEYFPYTLLRLAYPLAYQLRTLYTDKVGLRSGSDCLCYECLACARRTVEQYAFWRLDIRFREEVRMLQGPFYCLDKLLLYCSKTTDIFPTYVRLLHKHFSHGRRMNFFECVLKILLCDFYLVKNFGGDLGLLHIYLWEDPPQRSHGGFFAESFKVCPYKAMGDPR